jgi:hypothetical protein
MLNKLVDLFIGDIPVEHRRAFVRILFRGVFVTHILWACGWLGTLGLTGFAQAGEVDRVKKELTAQLDSLEKQVVIGQKAQTRTAYEAELRRINQEIFAVEARVRELTAAGLRADRIYDERVSDLRQERSRVESRLAAFLRANPDIAGATF